MVNHFISKSKESNLEHNDQSVDFLSRKVQQEVLALFLAENSLSFTLVPKVIELSQALSRDQTTLNAL